MGSYSDLLRFPLRAVCLVAAALAPMSAARAADVTNVMNAVVRVKTPVDEGVGFVVGNADDSVYVVTAKHVVADQTSASVFFNAARHKKYAAQVIHLSEEVDLAVLVAEVPAGAVRKSLGAIDVHEGKLAPLSVVSNISHSPDLWVLNAGVNKIQKELLNTVTLTKVGILEGASGGPLLDSENRLVGMVIEVDGARAIALKIKVVLDALRLWNVKANRLGATPADPTVILADAFNDNRNNWYVSNDPTAPAGVEQGRYKLGSKRNEWRYTTVPVALDPSQPFRISVKVTKIRGDADYFYGLMWGIRDSENFFNFAITSSGHVAVTVKNKGEFTNFVESAFVNPSVRTGNATNFLSIAKVDDNLQFSINESLVHEMPFQPFFGIFVGFLAYQDVHVAFDDLEIFGVRNRVGQVGAVPYAAAVEDPLHRIAREKGAEILRLGTSARGTLAENGTKQYAFQGIRNAAVLFTLEKVGKERLKAKADIRNTNDINLLEKNFYVSKTTFSFSPPKDGVYLLRLTGTSGFGTYIVEMASLTDSANE